MHFYTISLKFSFPFFHSHFIVTQILGKNCNSIRIVAQKASSHCRIIFFDGWVFVGWNNETCMENIAEKFVQWQVEVTLKQKKICEKLKCCTWEINFKKIDFSPTRHQQTFHVRGLFCFICVYTQKYRTSVSIERGVGINHQPTFKHQKCPWTELIRIKKGKVFKTWEKERKHE